MGALHSGHISLIEAAKKNGNLVVCSIFINPTQFNDKKDFDRYPSTIEKDISLLLAADTDVLFFPNVEEIYGPGHGVQEHYELGYLETVLEGSYRPGHFQGVCMVVRRLLEIVRPGILYLGQKDYQQCMVIKKLVELMGKTGDIKIQVCPTLREPGGLAMSSRNLRLSTEEKERATLIYKTLEYIKTAIKPGDLTLIKKEAVSRLTTAGFKVDYVEIADAETLELAQNWDGKKKLVALIAAFLNDVRLIDNLVLN